MFFPCSHPHENKSDHFPSIEVSTPEFTKIFVCVTYSSNVFVFPTQSITSDPLDLEIRQHVKLLDFHSIEKIL